MLAKDPVCGLEITRQGEHAVNPGRCGCLGRPGKLWLLTQALPAATMLEDICQLLDIRTDEVTLLSTPPEAHWLQQEPSPLLWLTEADSRWPDALVCPLAPGSAEKRALWQQLQPHLAARTA